MKKSLKIIFAVALAMILAISAICLTAFASENVPTPSLKITACTLSFDDSVYIMYAVPEASAAGADVKILYFTEPQAKDSDYNKANAKYCEEPIGKQNAMGESCYVFKNKHMNAKNMTDVVYARAYAEVGGVEYYSNLVKYSIYEYAYNTLAKIPETNPTATQTELKELLEIMLSYGAASQKYFKYNTDFLATDERIKITVAGGTLEDTCTKGFYKTGDTVTLTAKLEDDGTRAHWYNSRGEFITTADQLEITVGEANESYRVVPSDSFPISNVEDLLNIVNDPTEKYVLTNDIDLGGMNWTPFETFSGVLNGDGYKIYNFTMTENPNYSAVRAFIISNSGTIKNLTLSAFTYNFTEEYSDPGSLLKIGILTADNTGTIENCTLDGEAAIDFNVAVSKEETKDFYVYVGGFAAVNKGTVKDCINHSATTLTPKLTKYATHSGIHYYLWLYAGGIAGQNNGTITNSVVEGETNITAHTNKVHYYSYGNAVIYSFFGGLVGKNNWGTISKCVADVEITTAYTVETSKYGWANVDMRPAGLVCENSGTVENCVAAGSITVGQGGSWITGGIAATNSFKIINCCSKVNITSTAGKTSRLGGIAGENNTNGKIYSTVYSGTISVNSSDYYGFTIGLPDGTATDCYYTDDTVFYWNSVSVFPSDRDLSITASSLSDQTFVYDTLGWDEDIWALTDTLPELK